MKIDIPQLLKDVDAKYHRLIIIVGMPYSGKTDLLKQFSEQPNSIYLNLNLELSEKILNYSSAEQKNALNQILEEIITPISKNILLFDNIEILFDPNLDVNVLELFKKISRHQTCVVAWTGIITNSKLRFSDTGHWGNAQSYDVTDIEVINLNGVRDEV